MPSAPVKAADKGNGGKERAMRNKRFFSKFGFTFSEHLYLPHSPQTSSLRISLKAPDQGWATVALV
jgi:hypothetical protein